MTWTLRSTGFEHSVSQLGHSQINIQREATVNSRHVAILSAWFASKFGLRPAGECEDCSCAANFEAPWRGAPGRAQSD